MNDDVVTNLVAITGAPEQVARQLLEISGGDIQQAAVLFFDTDMAETLARQPAASASTGGGGDGGTASRASATRGDSSSNSRAQSRRRPGRATAGGGREDQHGVIHLDDSDDDVAETDFDDAEDTYEDEEMQDLDGGDVGSGAAPHARHAGDAAVAVSVARTAQEEEDEAMAKRLQEEMYTETGATSDGVRAPLGRTTEVLVDGGGGVGGGYDYAEQLFLERMRQRRRGRAANNPFNQVWDDSTAFPADGDNIGSVAPAAPPPTSRQARLADLFRPPYDLIERMSWEEARTVGKAEKRWLLVNIQDMSNFHCQALNRDIWKDAAVKQLVHESFLFLQYDKDEPDAESYIQYYMSGGQHENSDNYPHVGIVDPRTGEQVKVWAGVNFPTASEFHAQLAEFLDRYSLDASKKNPVQRAKKPQQDVPKDVGRMTEDEMLEMALRNSLATAGDASGAGEGGGSGESSGDVSRPSVQDPDELTMLSATAEGGDNKGKGKEEDVSPFARIASDRPHEEPAHDPATTTRIQFRHATGRVIRRFAVNDPVVRIYEWLKAAPLEGREGQEFELKVMPQGHDLLEDLDKTVEEAGLKQATVMIEYLEADE